MGLSVAHEVTTYQVVGATCNGLSFVLVCSLLWVRRSEGWAPLYAVVRPLEGVLPAWVRERRKALERESIARVVTSSIALFYAFQTLPQGVGPAGWQTSRPRVSCVLFGALSEAVNLPLIALHGYASPRLAYMIFVEKKGAEDAAERAVADRRQPPQHEAAHALDARALAQ